MPSFNAVAAVRHADKTMAVAQPAWLHVAAHLDPRYGGISAVLPSLCGAAMTAGAGTVSLAGFCLPDEQASAAGPVPTERLPLGKGRWLRDAALRQHWARRVASVDGVHIHGLWQEHCALTAHYCRSARVPYLVSAHGMLDPWAQQSKRWKKTLYRLLVENRTLRGAACLHALTQAEAQDYRNSGFQTPIAVVPNGVHVPTAATAEPFLSQFPHLREQRLVLFLARLHHKKGLDILCRAWARVASQHRDAHLVLAGPDFEDTRRGVEAAIAALGVARQVTFTGMLAGELKWNALAAATAFVLPSYSEGLSVSVLEALGTGKPVVISEQCHVPEVALQGCGWEIPADEQALETALRDLLSCSPQALADMGARGRALVERQYSWPVVGQHMAELYHWVLGGPQPSRVEVLR